MKLNHQTNRGILWSRPITLTRITSAAGWYNIIWYISSAFSNWYKMVLTKAFRVFTAICAFILIGRFNSLPLFFCKCGRQIKFSHSPMLVIYHTLKTNFIRIFFIPFSPTSIRFIFIPYTVFTLLLRKIFFMGKIIIALPFFAFRCLIPLPFHFDILKSKFLAASTFIFSMFLRVHLPPSTAITCTTYTMTIIWLLSMTIIANNISHKVIIP